MPTVYLKKDSGGKVLMEGGAVATAPACCCGGCLYDITIEASISGTTASSAPECGEVNIAVSGTSEVGEGTGGGEGCACSTEIPVSFTCPSDCWEEENVAIIVRVFLDGDESNWILRLTSEHAGADDSICGFSANIASDPMVATIPLGPDPTGTHIFSFADDDVASITWNITVEIT